LRAVLGDGEQRGRVFSSISTSKPRSALAAAQILRELV